MTLLEALSGFQADYHDESVVDISSYRPPAFRDPNTGIVQEAEAAIVGMNLSGAMVKLVDHPAGVRSLLRRWEHECRSRHARWPDHRDQPVCSQVAYAVVRDHLRIPAVADVLGLSEARALRLLLNGVRQMLHWQQLDDRLIPEASHDRELCSTCRLEDVG